MSDDAQTVPQPADGTGVPPATLGAAGYGGPVTKRMPALTPEQLAYEAGQRDMYRRLTTPRMTFWRVVCGILWGAIAAAFGVGAIYNIVTGNVGEVVAGAAIAGLAGWYDYRIWTLKARRLWFIV
jgi:hypothetical protein